MKILNICVDDWANFSYENMRALRSVGIDCYSVKMNGHSYYTDQSELKSYSDIFSMMDDYDVIQYFHDNLYLFNIIAPKLKGKKVIAYHTSSFYRKNFASVNQMMNPYVFKSVCAMPEFMALGAKNEIYMVGAVDTDTLVPNNFPAIYKFAHFPSNPSVKGTKDIVRLMHSLKVDFAYSTDSVPYQEQIKRISKCDIYIEMLTEKDGGGMPYGNFGITALEAAALGKVVITQNNHNSEEDIYYKTYGVCGLNFARDENKFIRLVELFSGYVGDHLEGQKQISREWVVKNHSYKATGEYFLKNVL